MIYLTFDTNIWIYALDDSWIIENQLDYIEHWVDKEKIKLLLPGEIAEEWKRNRSEQVKVRQERLQKFFKMAEEIIPDAFLFEYKKEATQSKIIESQLNRIENLFKKAKFISADKKIHDRVIRDGLNKKAPLHKKSSVADAIIVFTLIQFAKDNPGNNYIFVSGNVDDFFENKKGKKVHPDLEDEFNRYNIKLYRSLGNELVYPLKSEFGLDFPENLPQIRASRIKSKLKNKIYNPKYETSLSTGDDSFIFNRDTIDFILNVPKPTKEQVIFILALIDSDDTYKNYFFQNLTNLNWFDILKRQGFYNFEDAHSLSIEPIIYLKNLSTEVKKTGNSELISEIIFLIDSYSNNGIGNVRIWSLFVEILSNIPNDDIPVSILKFIPVWLKDDVHSHAVSMKLINTFLPNFLRNDPNSNELEKAEVIIGHLLSVEKKTNPSQNKYGLKNSNFQSRASTAILKNKFNSNLIDEIAQKCSDKIIIELANTINCLRFDFPLGIYIKFKTGKNEVAIVYDIKRDVLTIKDSENIEIFQSKNFEDLNRFGQEELIQIVKKGLNKNELEFKIEPENKFQLDILYTLIKYGSEPHKYDFQGELGESSRSDKAVDVFSFIFRELLNSKTQFHPDKGIELLNILVKDWEYRLPFFKNIGLYIIRKNWNIAENLFWEIVTDENSEIFFDSHYEKELYKVLEKHSCCFSENQLTTLNEIISNGPKRKSKKNYKDYEDHWKLRWYAALRKNPFFKDSYEKLSDRLNKTNVDFEEEGKARWMNGMKSPLTKKEILNRDISETIKTIRDFKPENRWEEGSIEGLSMSLKIAIQEKPEKFVKNLNKFENIPFVYGLQIANGLRDAWSEKKEFKWDEVLLFFKDYVSSEGFVRDKLRLENDVWKTGKDVVLGSISDLLREGIRTDDNAFELSLLPRAKELLKDIIKQLDTSDLFGINQMDYVHYSLNSTPGKVLNTLVNYSLRRARNLKLIDEGEKWEREIMNIWEDVFDNQILEGFITFGRYFPQFVFLNEQWSINKMTDFENLDVKYRYALLGGLSYSRPINKQIVYNALYPHFDFIFSVNVTVKSISEVGLHNHIIGYAIWAEKDLNESGRMLWEFINKGELEDIQSFLDYLWKQERSFSNYELEQQEVIQKLIEEIWCKIIDRFKNDSSSEVKKILLLTTRLLGYVLELKKHHIDLILSVKDNFGENDFFYQQLLIKNIHKLLYNGIPDETSRNIGKIISGLSLNYFVGSEKDKLKDIVLFLYQNGEVQSANVICDDLAKVGQNFLVEIYREYNN